MIVHAGRCITLDDIHIARHAEMDNGRAIVRVEQQVFRSSPDGRHDGARQSGIDVLADRPAQSSLTYHETLDLLAFEPGCDASPARFDFG